ncbi:MAG: FAD-binding oxidoreductase [Fimbriimonadales bacterium]
MRPDVAIVGGGVIGWSAAYNLSRLDPGLRVVVIDRFAGSGMGSTGLAAGGVRAQFSTEVNIALSKRSIAFFEGFHEATGEDPTFNQFGYLLVTASDEGARSLASRRLMQNGLGVAVEEWGPLALEEKAPYLRREDIVAACYGPKDGYLDPYAVCRGFEKASRAAEVGGINNTRVLAGKKGLVVTEHGSIECDTVLLCPGHWSRDTGESFGVDLPVKHERHMLALTGPTPNLPEQMPMVVDIDTSFHFRREGEGLLIGCNWNCPTPKNPDALAVFEFGFLQAIAEYGIKRLPLLNDVGFDTKRSWAGYYAETPDHHAIIGEADGVFVCTGFGGHGVMHSPAAGEAVAQLIVRGESEVDVSALRPSRFAEGDLIVEEMVI